MLQVIYVNNWGLTLGTYLFIIAAMIKYVPEELISVKPARWPLFILKTDEELLLSMENALAQLKKWRAPVANQSDRVQWIKTFWSDPLKCISYELKALRWGCSSSCFYYLKSQLCVCVCVSLCSCYSDETSKLSRPEKDQGHWADPGRPRSGWVWINISNLLTLQSFIFSTALSLSAPNIGYSAAEKNNFFKNCGTEKSKKCVLVVI